MKRYFKILDCDCEPVLLVTVDVKEGLRVGALSLMENVAATMSGSSVEVTEEQAASMAQKLAERG